MPICIILWKMLKIKLALNRLKRVKINAYRRSRNLPPIYQFHIRIVLCILRLLKFIFLRIFCFCLTTRFKPGSPSIWEKLFTDGTLANKVLKSIVGLIVGIIFTNCWIIFSVNQLNFDPVKTTWISMLGGSFLIFGLAFSETVRCYCFLVFPQFFTKKGRYALLCYALTLALSGPGKNITINMEILTESLVCGQDMAFNATRDLRELVQSPKAALGKVFQGISEAIKEATKMIRGSLRALIDIIKYIVNIIKSAYYYLKDISSVCNEEYGSLYDRCTLKFQEAHASCEDSLDFLPWNLNSAICSSVTFLQNLCYVSKAAEVLCWLPSLIKESILNPMLEFFENLWEKIKQALFDVKIKKHYKFEHKLNATKSFKDIAQAMHQDIMDRVQWMLEYIDIINLLVSLFMFLAFYKAYRYRRKFLKLDRHDNIYITKAMVEIDIQRRNVGKETAFPIKYRESDKFIQSSSLILTKEEKKLLKRQLIIVGISVVKILSYLVIDYVFYQFLLLLRKHGGIVIDTRKIIGFDVQVKGEGFLADMYRFILKALAPIGELMPIFDTTPCLPSPLTPNYYRYCLILFILFTVLLATVSEPYGLRLRHIICEMYYPERKIPRARWLYIHVLSTRQNFVEFAASSLKAMVTKKNPEAYHISCLDRLSHTAPGMRKLLYLLGYRKKKCFLCGKSGDEDDRENFIDCLKCFTVYCKDCYEDIGNTCVVCNSPVEYDDLSSDESGSPSDMEEDDEYTKLINITLKRRKVELAAPELKNIGKLPSSSEGSDEESSINEDLSTSTENIVSSSESGNDSTSPVVPSASSDTTENVSGSVSKESPEPKYDETEASSSEDQNSDEKYMNSSTSYEFSTETELNKPDTKDRTSYFSNDSSEKSVETTSDEISSMPPQRQRQNAKKAFSESELSSDEPTSDDEESNLLKSSTEKNETLMKKLSKFFKTESAKRKVPGKAFGSRKVYGSSKIRDNSSASNFVPGPFTEAESQSSSAVSTWESTSPKSSYAKVVSKDFRPEKDRHASISITSSTPLKTRVASESIGDSSLLNSIKAKLELFSDAKLNKTNNTLLSKEELDGMKERNSRYDYDILFPFPAEPIVNQAARKQTVKPTTVVGTNPRFETYNKFQAVLAEMCTTNFVAPLEESSVTNLDEKKLGANSQYQDEDDPLTLDPLDSPDEFGNYHCHHNQPEDPATIEKYSDVISELSAQFDANSARELDDLESPPVDEEEIGHTEHYLRSSSSSDAEMDADFSSMSENDSTSTTTT